MNNIYSFILSVILHFFILKSWVYIIESNNDIISYKVDVADVIVDINSFTLPSTKPSINRSLKKVSNDNKNNVVSSNLENKNIKIVKDNVGPLLSEKDFENSYVATPQNFNQNFQVRNNSISDETFEINREKKAINYEGPNLNRKSENKYNFTKNNSIKSRRKNEYNIDEGIEDKKGKRYSKNIEEMDIQAIDKGNKAIFTYRPPFIYPLSAEKEGIEGEVILIVEVDSSENITKVLIEKKAHPVLDEDAVRKAYNSKIALYNEKGMKISGKGRFTQLYRLNK